MGWRVTGARGSEDPVNGRFIPVMVVSVVTDNNDTQEFRIPQTQYNDLAVKAIIDAWYERHVGVIGLTGG